jgi:hypothetical protein
VGERDRGIMESKEEDYEAIYAAIGDDLQEVAEARSHCIIHEATLFILHSVTLIVNCKRSASHNCL